MTEEKKAIDSIGDITRAMRYLAKLNIQDPNMAQVQKYLKFERKKYQNGESAIQNVRGKIRFLEDLGLDDLAEKLLSLYHRINSGMGKETPKLDTSKSFLSLEYQVFYVEKPTPRKDKFQSLAERVEKTFSSPEGRALLKAYHYFRDPEFAQVKRADEETSKTTRRFHSELEETTHEYTWEFTVCDAEKILKAFYHLHPERVPDNLSYLAKGLTKKTWKSAFSLVRSVQNDRAEVKKFEPTYKESSTNRWV